MQGGAEGEVEAGKETERKKKGKQIATDPKQGSRGRTKGARRGNGIRAEA